MRKVFNKRHNEIASCFSKNINFTGANVIIIKKKKSSCVLIPSCLRDVRDEDTGEVGHIKYCGGGPTKTKHHFRLHIKLDV